MALLGFGAVMLLIAAAAAIPMVARSDRRVDDAGALVMGAGILALGLGVANLVTLLVFLVRGDVGAIAVVLGVAPITAGLLALRVVRSRPKGTGHVAPLLLAAVLVLAGIPAAVSLPVAILAGVVAALCFLAGIGDPRTIARKLDPRV